MNLSFFAAPADFPPLLDACLGHPGARLFEAYSELNTSVREFAAGTAAAAALDLGHDHLGTGTAGFLGLWAPDVMPRPTTRRLALSAKKYPPGTWRETTEGCGIFWFQTGGVNGQQVTASTLSAFTERGARAKCVVTPGPDTVDWRAHDALGKELTRAVRRLAAARAGRLPVLPAAFAAHRAGALLLPRPHGTPLDAA